MSKTKEQLTLEQENKILLAEIEKLKKVMESRVDSYIDAQKKTITYLKECMEERQKIINMINNICVALNSENAKANK